MFCKRDGYPVSPRLLDCLHTGCHDCLEQSVRSDCAIECLLCHQVTKLTGQGVSGLRADHVSNQEKASSLRGGTELFCEECSEPDQSATSFCEECGLLLCQFHVSAHAKSRRTVHHRIIAVCSTHCERAARQAPAPSQFGKELDTFCHSCGVFLCRERAGGHGQHKLQYVRKDEELPSYEFSFSSASAVDKTRDVCDTEQGMLTACERIHKDAKLRSEELDARAEVVSDSIADFVAELKELLEKNRETLLAQLGSQMTAMKMPVEAVLKKAEGICHGLKALQSLEQDALNLHVDGKAAWELGWAVSKQRERLKSSFDALQCEKYTIDGASVDMIGFKPAQQFKLADGLKVGNAGSVRVSDVEAVSCLDGRIAMRWRMAFLGKPLPQDILKSTSAFNPTDPRMLFGDLQVRIHCKGQSSEQGATTKLETLQLRSIHLDSSNGANQIMLSCLLNPQEIQYATGSLKATVLHNGYETNACSVAKSWSFLSPIPGACQITERQNYTELTINGGVCITASL